VDDSPGLVIRKVMRPFPLAFVGLLAVSACGSNASEPVGAPSTATGPASTTEAPASTTTSRPPEPVDSPPPDDGNRWMLADFATPASVDAWYVQNDTVMGGVSSSSVEFDAGTMVFSGVLSTDNNGGFTSTRGPVLADAPAEGWTSMSIEAEGDGRTYLVQVRTDTDSYVQRFTPAETMSVTELRLADFEATDWRLSPLTGRAPLTSEAIRQVSIYLVDKQEGEFVLRVRSLTLGTPDALGAA